MNVHDPLIFKILKFEKDPVGPNPCNNLGVCQKED